MSERDPLWFKDAVFYELHVRSFFDSNNDGFGDFQGLMQKLDYLQDLGVDTLWLLPFYPSPLKDDGYDIADYRAVNPAYGTMRDFRAFVKAAHERGLHIVTELVVNHTSDQHPWFQRARAARKGSPARNYYVWSDSDRKYPGTRIIFTDTEKSNWTWDDEAKQFFWHRFFSHQPDLNYDNPAVVREVIRTMRYWLDMGVDGLRLDAVPYLCEREGTNNENLPETHGVLKLLRRALDESHPGRVFLAEANQWPEDVLPYFGNGDECQMGFHFPLMPRMYMALAQEDRLPITDIMRQTPDIPASCQWAIFLRNHDELTLEMVTDRERDYLWNRYAADRQARINVGIRRRLAPLMDNDRRKIELLNGMLFSMPGTPIIYYGDEIGMGDNFFLGDRNGVRTPMQWSEDRNGGFSRADPARLVLPPIMDPVYGYGAINVEAQARNPSSLLNWMKRLIAIRRSRRTFGRGSLRFFYPANRKILAYLREYENESILCVVNLSSSAQGVELNLGEFRGRVPIELFGHSAFPPIGDLPYFLTLPAYGWYWFLLASQADAPIWHAPLPLSLPEFVTVVVPTDGWGRLLTGASGRTIEHDVLAPYLSKQRWYADKDHKIASVEVLRSAFLASPSGGPGWHLPQLAVRLTDGGMRQYFVPLGACWGEPCEDFVANQTAHVMARLRSAATPGALVEATAQEDFARALLAAMQANARLPGSDGPLAAFGTKALGTLDFGEAPEVKRLSVEQSNTSLNIGDKAVLKIIRRPPEGVSVEFEMAQFLSERMRFANTPPLLGGLAAVDAAGRSTTLALLHGFIRNQGDAWGWALDYIQRFLEEVGWLPDEEQRTRITKGRHADFLSMVATLGVRTGEMHRALATRTDDPDFDPAPIDDTDVEVWERRIREQALAALQSLTGAVFPEAKTLRDSRDHLLDHLSRLLPRRVDACKTRIHGDYHLGQVLIAKSDVYIVDFEGEPRRNHHERRAKDSPLRDVAGLARSFDYAAWAVLLRIESARPGAIDKLAPLAREWQRLSVETFIKSWLDTMRGSCSCPADAEQFQRLLHLFLMEKACYEICYEAANRPNWLHVPVLGVLNLLNAEESNG